jgi:NADPH:quinone reductase-like Zn-dependent oxidoreductase
MKAAVMDAPGPPETMHVEDVPLPRLGHDHVLIALDYAGVGIWDAQQRAGTFGTVVPGTISGVDGGGTIAAIGAGVRDFSIGDRVYSYSYGQAHGFYAEYVNVPASRVARVPAQLGPAVAGGMPCVALTALTGLETLKLRKDQTLLVFGASGGVGSLGVWLGHTLGATVVGTARSEAQAYVRELGAAHVIDAHATDLTRAIERAAPQGFDAVLITAGAGELSAFLPHVKSGAPIAYPNGVEPVPQAADHPVSGFDGEASAGAFQRLNATIGARTIPLRIEEFSLQDVVEAHRRVEQGHVVGKIVLRIA